METDVEVLRDRIEHLEQLMGPPAPRGSPCLHQRARTAQEELRKHVPDEMAAASRAVSLLSRTTPSMRGLAHARQSRVAQAEVLVDRVGAALTELEGLRDGVRLDASSLHVQPALKEQLVALQDRVSGEVVHIVQDEEQAVDKLLMDFNDATARLNSRILALAGAIRDATNGDA